MFHNFLFLFHNSLNRYHHFRKRCFIRMYLKQPFVFLAGQCPGSISPDILMPFFILVPSKDKIKLFCLSAGNTCISTFDFFRVGNQCWIKMEKRSDPCFAIPMGLPDTLSPENGIFKIFDNTLPFFIKTHAYKSGYRKITCVAGSF